MPKRREPARVTGVYLCRTHRNRHPPPHAGTRMSEHIKHECGLALVRLRKPLNQYYARYGSPMWGLQQMFLLIEKQHNRGQDGAGLAALRLDRNPGDRYIALDRVVEPSPPWQALIGKVSQQAEALLQRRPELATDAEALKQAFPFQAELLMGHVRYATQGESGLTAVHPVWRKNNWPNRTLLMAGNFNLTNNQELFEKLVRLGQHPEHRNDTVTALERVGHFLDEAVTACGAKAEVAGFHDPIDAAKFIRDELDVFALLRRAAKSWDGGYLMGGLIGHGDAFALRDPNAIRPGYYYVNDEVVVVASERQAIATTFNLHYQDVEELPAGHALVCKYNGQVAIQEVRAPERRAACSFERVYFSRGNDADIYTERKELGRLLVPQVMDAIDHDLENTVFSYIPNTAQVAFWGLLKGLEDELNVQKQAELMKFSQAGELNETAMKRLLSRRVRVENAVLKDTKLRTFITHDAARDHMAANVYDITFGSLRPGLDRLVVLDDSIVRGTTLRRSILRILNRLQPKEMVVVSSAPQIRYPDCYGIDMSQIERFIAFEAAVALHRERGTEQILLQVFERCQALEAEEQLTAENAVQALFAPFAAEEISAKIAQLLQPSIEAPLKVVYQSVANLHRAIPNHPGDWYFTGDYPTPGGRRVVNRAYMNFFQGKKERAYA